MALAGCINWQQQDLIEYLQEEVRVLRELQGPEAFEILRRSAETARA